MMLNQICKERHQLLSQYQILQDKLKTLPKGNLLCVRNGNYTKWYKSNGSSPIYLPKKKHELIQQLALRKYYTLQLDELSQEIQLLDQCIKSYKAIQFKSSSLLDTSSCYHSLLTSHINAFPDKVQNWISSDYVHNTEHSENLIHKTISGHLVRSKSEVIIANSLYRNKIPYRYECALHLNDLTFYPDFTILHPRTTALFYWEHFGMMDLPSYCENAFNKLKIYANQGIIPSIQLITTYETKNRPIDSGNIQRIIEDFFLS